MAAGPLPATFLRVGPGGLTVVTLQELLPGDDIVAVVCDRNDIKTRRFRPLILSVLRSYLGTEVIEQLHVDRRIS